MQNSLLLMCRPWSRNALLVGCTAATFGVAVAVALYGRMAGIDQSYLMLLAQEVHLGRAKYTQLHALELPAGIYIHLPSVVLSRLLDTPVMEGWNVYLVVLSAVSAYLFASLPDLKSRLAVMLIWFGCMALGFDDHLFGQRDFFFAVAWFPYIAARLSRPTGRVQLQGIVLGLLLSVIVCAKPTFALSVIAVDLPVLLFCRKRQSIVPFLALIIGGAIQVVHFFLFEPVPQFLMLLEKVNYYSTVGYKLYPTLVAFLSTSEAYVLAVVVLVLLGINPRKSIANRYVLACAVTGLVSLTIGILQGHPRNYYFIPVVLSAVAASLYSLFYHSDDSTEGVPCFLPDAKIRLLQASVLAAAILQLLFMEGGAGRALLKKYAWGNPDTARIGKSVRDEYMDWVLRHVSKDEELSVIALQYGVTSAWDPVLSTLRLGRRVNSYTPILQFPLRVALVSGDKLQIEDAWKTLTEEIITANAEWVIIRRTAPEPLEPDFISLIKKHPHFYDWLVANYPHQEQFGEYVAFRRARK